MSALVKCFWISSTRAIVIWGKAFATCVGFDQATHSGVSLAYLAYAQLYLLDTVATSGVCVRMNHVEAVRGRSRARTTRQVQSTVHFQTLA